MNDLIKGWASVCLGSFAGAALGAASFFAIDALMLEQSPLAAQAPAPAGVPRV